MNATPERQPLPDTDPTSLICLAAAGAALNDQATVAACIRAAVTQHTRVEYIYEALLQTYLFAGFPAAIEALATLDATLEELNVPRPHHTLEEYNIAHFKQRGEVLCRKIYTTAYNKMRARVDIFAPDLDQWMIIEGYGKTLSRSGLPLDLRELVIVSVLSVLGWRNQLYSHIRGAINVGVAPDVCKHIIITMNYFNQPDKIDMAIKVFSSVMAGKS